MKERTFTESQLRNVLKDFEGDVKREEIADALSIRLEPRKLVRVGHLYVKDGECMVVTKREFGSRSTDRPEENYHFNPKDLHETFGAFGGNLVKVTVEEVL